MASAFEEMIEVARRVGITVRHARLGGAGGGIASVKGRRQLFIDLDAEPADQLERTAAAMARVSEINEVFVRPDVRELIERYQRPDSVRVDMPAAPTQDDSQGAVGSSSKTGSDHGQDRNPSRTEI